MKRTRTAKARRRPARAAGNSRRRKASPRGRKTAPSGAAARTKKETTVKTRARGPRKAKPVSFDTLQVQIAMDQLAKAQTEMNARSIDLLAVADGLGRTAVESCKANMVCSLVEDELLADLKRLQEYLASALGVPADLQLVAEAALNWLTRHFELTEHLRRGQTLEVPAPQMGQYELDGPQPDPGGSLVQLRVMTPGWKRRGRSIIPPRVTALPAAPEIADTAASAPEVPPSEGNYF